MKKVIFLCLLSLSVCLSKPAEDQAAPTQAATNGTPEKNALTTPEQVPVSPVANPTSPVNKKDLTQATRNVTETATPQNTTGVAPNPALPPIVTASSPALNPTETASSTKPAADTSKPGEDNNTTHKDVSPKSKDPTQKNTETQASNTTSTDVKPDEGMAKNGTVPVPNNVTPKPELPKTTEAPKSDKPKNFVQARGFDGPSFIGGIILTLGLLAIGFMGFKYYKNQTERNYHTL